MKICIVQTKPVTGHIELNIVDHKRYIHHAVSHGAALIIFPELSLTGYEPTLAKELAMTQDDQRLDEFQRLADSQCVTIGVGVPLRSGEDIHIALVLFHPYKTRTTYVKSYLHSDELAFFTPADHFPTLQHIGYDTIALAICYELSVPGHAAEAYRAGAAIYMASVAKFEQGVDAAIVRLSEIAKTYGMMVCLSNSIGEADGGVCAGRSSLWDATGSVRAQLGDNNTGIILFDTVRGDVITEVV